MRKKSEQGLGTVRTVRDRATGEIIGYRALLPREYSTKRPGSSGRYQEPIGDVMKSRADARGLLNAAIKELRNKGAFGRGLPLSHYVGAAIRSRLQEARRKYGTEARAKKHLATWRSIERVWLPKATWFNWPPHDIAFDDAQVFFDFLRDEAEGQKGEPLSSSFIRQVAGLVKASLKAAKVHPNIANDLELPKRNDRDVPYLDLPAQRRLLGSDDISVADRVMIGCGMGAGLRVGELLSIEAPDVHIADHDPHLVIRYGGADRAPTKSGKPRRVELFEPGLGFWRLHMRNHFRKGAGLVFAGPKGGYQKHWPARFPEWAAPALVERLSSHIMRHTYAVSALSGTWGYEPRSIEFVSTQLGHGDITTTQRYYGAFEAGVWQREVQRMTGRASAPRRVITAEELLGLAGDENERCAADAQTPISADETDIRRLTPSLTRNSKNLDRIEQSDALAHQPLLSQIEGALEAAAAGDPRAAALMIAALDAAFAFLVRLDAGASKARGT